MTAQLTEEIALAELHLEDFEVGVSDQLALTRLGADQPRNPLLISYWALRAMAGLMAIATCLTLAVPVLNEDVLRMMASSTMATILPGLTFAAAVGFAIAAVAMRQAAVYAGKMAPLLPAERKQHLRLVHNVQQLSAEKRIRDRATSTPAPARARVNRR